MWIMHNAHLHVVQPVVNLYIDYAWETLHQPPYSLDLSPPDFDQFSKLKELLYGTCFESLDELSLAVAREVHNLNKKKMILEWNLTTSRSSASVHRTRRGLY